MILSYPTSTVLQSVIQLRSNNSTLHGSRYCNIVKYSTIMTNPSECNTKIQAYITYCICVPRIVVGIATGLDGPGIESRWGRDFSAPVQTGPGAHPASCSMGTASFPGVKSGRGVMLTLHPLLVPRS